ncbi:MAG: helix-turn-helix domain-containing protein, partial [Nanoarchaeota archaeon]|nr:helix-turn-helix domain-containing protein [Nanoarchaeota archaeon]
MIIKLKKLGLSPYEAKSYIVLVKFGPLSGKNIAKKAEVPPTSVYRNLESLREKGFVQILQKEPLIYQAVDPEVAITHYVNLKKVIWEEIEQGAIEELAAVKEIGVINKEKEVLEIYGGRKQGYIIGKRLIETAHQEFLLIGSGSQQSMIDIIHSLRKARKRKVVCHYILTNYGDNNKDLIAEVKALGVRIKYYPLK